MYRHGVMRFTCICTKSFLAGKVCSMLSIDNLLPEDEPSFSKQVENVKN